MAGVRQAPSGRCLPSNNRHFMDSTRIKIILIGFFATFIAIYLGVSAATAHSEAILWVLGVSVLVICLLLGKRIWLLIPLLGAVETTVRLPGLPTSLVLGQVLVVGFTVLLILMRRLPFRLRMTELEWWALLIAVMVVQVYLRHPVGMNFFGGSSVGGKPYLLFMINLSAALVLFGTLVPDRELWTALRLSIYGGLANLAISLLSAVFPTMGYWTTSTYANPGEQGNSIDAEAVDRTQATRVYFLLIFGRNLSLWISSFISPLRACFHPGWGVLVLMALLAGGLSGFRNGLAMVVLTFFVGVCYRGGGFQVMVSLLGGGLMIALLSVVNLVSPLPPNVQRTLSFLPGTWEDRYVTDAKNSTDWRVDMWKEALLTDRWIHNKWLGDGLGFTMEELKWQASFQEQQMTGRGRSGLLIQQEAFMISGSYHSGPVQTVRTIGYVGLMIMLVFQIRLAIHAHRQIMRCRGTSWYPVALFFGIPLVWNPFFFAFVFGEFSAQVTILLMGAAMMRMLENNLPLPAWVPRPRYAAVGVPTRFKDALVTQRVAR